MKFYKEQILKGLVDTGWELIEKDEEMDWWAEELWIIKSIKQSWGYRLFLYFLVDPQYDGNDKGSAVWSVVALENRATERPLSQDEVAELYLQKGKFNENITLFIESVTKYRNTVGS